MTKQRIAQRMNQMAANRARIEAKLKADPGNPKAGAWKARLAEYARAGEILALEGQLAKLKNPGDVTVDVPAGKMKLEGK